MLADWKMPYQKWCRTERVQDGGAHYEQAGKHPLWPENRRWQLARGGGARAAAWESRGNVRKWEGDGFSKPYLKILKKYWKPEITLKNMPSNRRIWGESGGNSHFRIAEQWHPLHSLFGRSATPSQLRHKPLRRYSVQLTTLT